MRKGKHQSRPVILKKCTLEHEIHSYTVVFEEIHSRKEGKMDY